MSSKKAVERMMRLARHRKFIEDRAEIELRAKTEAMRAASADLDDSRRALEEVSSLKGSLASADIVDISIYQQALHFEHAAATAVLHATDVSECASSERDTAFEGHVVARKGCLAADERLGRVQGQWRLQIEKDLSDQAADHWLADKVMRDA